MNNGNNYQEDTSARWAVLCTNKVFERCRMQKKRVKSKLRSVQRGGKECGMK